MATKTKKTAGTFKPPVEETEPKAPATAPELRALQNLTPDLTGLDRRVYKGDTFTPTTDRVHDLVKRRKIAEPVEGDG